MRDIQSCEEFPSKVKQDVPIEILMKRSKSVVTSLSMYNKTVVNIQESSYDNNQVWKGFKGFRKKCRQSKAGNNFFKNRSVKLLQRYTSCSTVINKRVFVLRNSHLYDFQKELSKYDGHDESNMSYHERGFKNALSNYIEMNNIFT